MKISDQNNKKKQFLNVFLFAFITAIIAKLFSIYVWPLVDKYFK